MNLLYKIGAVLGGLISGMVIIGIVQWISSLIYVPPADLDWNDNEAMARWVSTLPAGAFLMVIVSEAGGCFAGTLVARFLTKQRFAIPALIVLGLLMIGAIVNLVTLPHPIWFAPVSIISTLIAGLGGLVLAAPESYVIQSHRTVNAPIERNFKTLATAEEFRQAVPGIEKIEFLSQHHYGIGTRFRETRMMNGKEAATELEVTELVENQHIRLVSDAGGSNWDTIFRLTQMNNSVELTMQMNVRPRQLFAWVITPMILGIVWKLIDRDLDSVKQYCEQSVTESDP